MTFALKIPHKFTAVELRTSGLIYTAAVPCLLLWSANPTRSQTWCIDDSKTGVDIAMPQIGLAQP